MYMKQRLFSGIQSSGNLHIGNYLGAIRQWTDLQDEYETIVCVVDLHAITVPQDPVALRARTLEIVKIYLASGIDPSKATLFVQSHVQEHAELGWILNTIARLGDLEKMTQFKDKSGKSEKETVGVGLFDYPVLMAADILLYDTAVVPVGRDQLQHIELARTLARRFNERFGETFVIPEGKVSKEGQLIMGLDDPMKKMSKSAASAYNYIALNDDPELARKKIMKAVTDSGSEIAYQDDPVKSDAESDHGAGPVQSDGASDHGAGKPALRNLINIYSLLSGKNPQEIVAMYAGKGYADFKRDLAEVVAKFLTEFQAGAERARAVASAKMKDVRDKVGFL